MKNDVRDAQPELTPLPVGIPRWVDVLLSLFLLLLAAPLLLFFMALIVLTSGFPVFFRQKRMGMNGQVFEMLKLRTMKGAPSSLAVTATGDSRVTFIGHILRVSKLDELPALWNVVRGDMALV